MNCNHRWQPYADAERIWQTCVLCGEEKHVTTHRRQLVENFSYVLSFENRPAPRWRWWR